MTQETFGAPRTGRRTELRRQRRRQRRRNTAIALGVAVVVLLGTTLYFVLRDGDKDVDAGVQSRTQQTLLLQVRGGRGDAVLNALLAHDAQAGNGAAVLIPSQLLVTVSGSGSSTLGKALQDGTQESTRNALADLVGVVVDAGWTLDLPGLTRLVDGLGGVTVDVDVPVLSGRSVVVDIGPQKLDGARAGAFVTYLATGEQEQARLARLQELLDGVLAAVPEKTRELPTLLTTLGGGSVSTLAPPQLADYLKGLAADDDRAELQYDVLPVVSIDPGNGITAFRIDQPRSEALVDRLLAQSIPSGRRDTGNRVLVLNGVGTPNIAEAARTKLLTASFVFAGKRNADRFDYRETLVLVPEATVADQQLGERVAKALGVPATSVRTSSSVGGISDVIVVLGRDFKP